ncbi:GNAT family N-acetyltransferase [Pelagicoccus enzymogenes]|uniref:GNAT family N-acetyltransferase n=1 Tax=Pelagicoccus enzymogenes TaxID=2773457 RepID=UPI00280F5BE1|nr:GNAT family N-acetyltransferase [Pelagicoccus enzymogenes]MDQ8198658.1 GNAT family N-acetyltransferase [Pelagicoccus enzymogenes]
MKSENEPALARGAVVTLREITKETFDDFCELSVADEQKKFVAPNDYSVAEAHFNPGRAWLRGIYADEKPIGFLMLDDQPSLPEYYLWRFMIDARFQSMGFGSQALELLIDHVRTRPGAKELLTSIVPAKGGPQAFYEKHGFKLTGEIQDGESMMRLKL